MVFKDFKKVIDTYTDENAQVYVEVQLGDNIYLQQPVMALRREEGAYSTYYIITGTDDNQSS